MQTTEVESMEEVGEHAKWSWSSRDIPRAGMSLCRSDASTPEVGDLALLTVEKIGYHDTIVSSDNRKLRIYPGDRIVGVFGNRYATDAYEGRACGTKDLRLLTAGGMVGTLLSKHEDIEKPTALHFVGYLVDSEGEKINLKKLKFRKALPTGKLSNLIVVVGTGMNTGKTTVSRRLIRSLYECGLRVAACKLTGSVSNRDQDEMRSASATVTLDFSDYGFPSTYLASKEELIDLFNTLLSDVEKFSPDVIVMEIADGVLQRETRMLLEDPFFKEMVGGIVLAAESSLSGLFAVKILEEMEYKVACVSGKMTSSPLYVREFQSSCKVPILPSGEDTPILGALDVLAENIPSLAAYSDGPSTLEYEKPAFGVSSATLPR